MANKSLHNLVIKDNNYEIVDASVRGSMADEYSSSSTYSVGDFVMHNGQLYECNTTIGTAEAWNSSHWTAKTVADELSSLIGDLSDKLDAPSSPSSGDFLVYNGTAWVAQSLSTWQGGAY